MAIVRQQLKTAMQRVLNKLLSYQQPLCDVQATPTEGEMPTSPLESEMPTSPLESEIRASADVMNWMSARIEDALPLLRIEPVQARKNWPNVNDWVDMISQLRTLTSANEEFLEAQKQLIAQCVKIKRQSPGENRPDKAHRRKFLPFESQYALYKVPVHYYYKHNIEPLPHKQQMVHWAAVFLALARETGLRNKPFCGPDFDNFVYGHCGIKYNVSSDMRGRYRRVGEIYDLYKAAQPNDELKKQINEYVSVLSKLFSKDKAVIPGYKAQVPLGLEE